MPEGFGLNCRKNGLNIGITSDGEGGVNVTATSDSLSRQVKTTRRESENRIRDETSTEETEEKRPGIRERLRDIFLFPAVALFIYFLIKPYLKRH